MGIPAFAGKTECQRRRRLCAARTATGRSSSKKPARPAVIGASSEGALHPPNSPSSAGVAVGVWVAVAGTGVGVAVGGGVAVGVWVAVAGTGVAVAVGGGVAVGVAVAVAGTAVAVAGGGGVAVGVWVAVAGTGVGVAVGGGVAVGVAVAVGGGVGVGRPTNTRSKSLSEAPLRYSAIVLDTTPFNTNSIVRPANEVSPGSTTRLWYAPSTTRAGKDW